MASRRVLTEEEILQALQSNSDVEDLDANEDCEEMQYFFDRVVPPETMVVPRSDEARTQEENEVDCDNVEEVEEVTLSVIVDTIPSTGDSPKDPPFLRCTPRKEIIWVNRKHQPPVQNEFNPIRNECIEIRSPYSYFMKYFDDDFFAKAAFYTNCYAVQKGSSSFRPCTELEIRILFAQHFMMNCMRFPRVRMFFDKRWGMPFFYENMTVNRFFALRTHLHITDISERPAQCTDRLYQVRPVLEQVRRRLHLLPLEENLCVDEQIIPFKGKFTGKQYVKGKPCPWGIKVYFLCGKSGIPYDFIVYQGSTTPLDAEGVKSIGSGSTIVLQLAKRIPVDAKGHKLYFDNYFPSFALFEILYDKGIQAAGTVRVNRFNQPPLPDPKTMAKRGRGYSAECFSANGKVTFTRWFDNKVVNLASNFIGIGNKDKAKRWDKEKKEYIEVDRPEVVRLYNDSMGGVDLLDQMIQYYRINIRSRKWTVRVIMHFMDLAMTAAWMEYRQDCTANLVPKKDILNAKYFYASNAKIIVLLFFMKNKIQFA